MLAVPAPGQFKGDIELLLAPYFKMALILFAHWYDRYSGGCSGLHQWSWLGIQHNRFLHPPWGQYLKFWSPAVITHIGMEEVKDFCLEYFPSTLECTFLQEPLAHMLFCHAYRASECTGYAYMSLLRALLLTFHFSWVRLTIVILPIAQHWNPLSVFAEEMVEFSSGIWGMCFSVSVFSSEWQLLALNIVLAM